MKYLLTFLVLVAAPVCAQPNIEKAKQLLDQKKYTELTALLDKVDDDSPEYAAAQYYLGRAAFDQKKFDDAADYFEEATESKNGQQADYYNWLGDSYGSIAGEANVLKQGMLAPKMKSAWEKAIALDPKNLAARFSLIQFYSQAPGFMGGGMDKAKDMAKQITAISPAQGHRSMGNLFVREKDIAAAEKEYIQMAKLDPTLAPALGNFYVNQKMFDKGFAFYDDVIKKDPTNMTAAYQLGKSAALSGQRLDEGEQYLLKYLAYTPKQNEPSHAGANMRLAQVYEKKGRKSEAKQKYETALKMDGTLQEAKDGLGRVSKP